MTLILVVDDVIWSRTPVTNEALVEGLEVMAEMLRDLAERKEHVLAGDDLYEVARIEEASLYQILFVMRDVVPQRLRVELQKRLDKVASIPASEIEEIEVSVNGELHVTAAVSYGAMQARAGNAVGILTPNFSGRKGRLEVECAHETVGVHFIPDEPTRLVFVRGVLVKVVDEDEFAGLSGSAFPRLHFVDDVFDGLRKLSKPLRDIAEDLVKHLSVLSDHGREIFDLKIHKAIEDRFRGHGVDISPENKETLADAKCLRARSRDVDGMTLVFEWHTKIEPHKDRVHVHSGATVTGGRVSIGVIHEHLPLPGD